MHIHSTLLSSLCRLLCDALFFTQFLLIVYYNIMTTTDKKIDTLLRSIEALQELQARNQVEMTQKSGQLESEVTASQDEPAQRVVKRMRLPEFKRKGHERQYHFIEEVKDRVEEATELLSKVKPANAQDAANIQAARDELEAGTRAMITRQKLICIKDRSWLAGGRSV